MPGYPNPDARWVESWHEQLKEFGLTPSLMDTFVDVSCGGHRQMSIDEGVQQLVTQMKLANRHRTRPNST